jgi:hypothetical protein
MGRWLVPCVDHPPECVSFSLHQDAATTINYAAAYVLVASVCQNNERNGFAVRLGEVNVVATHRSELLVERK